MGVYLDSCMVTKPQSSLPRQEIETLETRVSQAKERYQQTIYSAKDGKDTLSALPQFPVNDKFVLNQDEAWYTLSIEIQLPIDTVVLQVSHR